VISISNVTKQYDTRSGPVRVLDGVTLSVRPGQKIGVLGRNGAGKSTLIRLISGAELPSSGTIERHMSVSWPLAFGGAFQGSLTGADNLRFICRVYGAPFAEHMAYVQDFAELGRYLWEPVKTYSAGMRARLAFAISMVIDFDCFLIDEIVAVGDTRFQEKCQIELFEERRDKAKIIVAHDSHYIQQHCDSAAVLHQGKLHVFDNVEGALAFYAEQMAAA
jgi:capsular polysaccharide transport system ATP-binding protein